MYFIFEDADSAAMAFSEGNLEAMPNGELLTACISGVYSANKMDNPGKIKAMPILSFNTITITDGHPSHNFDRRLYVFKLPDYFPDTKLLFAGYTNGEQFDTSLEAIWEYMDCLEVIYEGGITDMGHYPGWDIAIKFAIILKHGLDITLGGITTVSDPDNKYRVFSFSTINDPDNIFNDISIIAESKDKSLH